MNLMGVPKECCWFTQVCRSALTQAYAIGAGAWAAAGSTEPCLAHPVVCPTSVFASCAGASLHHQVLPPFPRHTHICTLKVPHSTPSTAFPVHLCCERVSQLCDECCHSGDGRLLHLLVLVLGRQTVTQTPIHTLQHTQTNSTGMATHIDKDNSS